MFLDVVRCLLFEIFLRNRNASWKQKETIWCQSCCCDVPTGSLFFSFSDFTLWYLKIQTEHDAIIGRMQKTAYFTLLQRLLSINCRDSTLFAVYAQNISQTVYFAPISYFLGVWSSCRHEKRQQSWRKAFSLLLKSVEITAVNELNTNGVKSITVQRSQIA